ncbi:MAG: hypothetical protein NZL96_01180 [Patescibacteria group bacterium]|nr:hypothetical protein [Patescibacteria group bacterium]
MKKAFVIPIVILIGAFFSTSAVGITYLRIKKNQNERDRSIKHQKSDKETLQFKSEKVENQLNEKNITEIEIKNLQIKGKKENSPKDASELEKEEKKLLEMTLKKSNQESNSLNQNQAKKPKTNQDFSVSSQEISPTKINTQVNYVDPPRPGSFIFIGNELQLSLSKEDDGVRLSWTRCQSDQFVAYKIVRSETANDVYFPRDGAIGSISNQDALSYLDHTVQSGKTYHYRICSLEKNGESWCGNVATISF